VLHTRSTLAMDRYPAIASRIKLIGGLDIAERRLPQDGRIGTRVAGREVDIRISSIPAVHGESLVLRLLPKERGDIGMHRIGMEPDHKAQFLDWLQWPNGLVLVTGPTGSGKSTTLYSATTATASSSPSKILSSFGCQAWCRFRPRPRSATPSPERCVPSCVTTRT